MGTLFLDEIGEMPAALQTRFLRVLQEREYRPLGSTRTLRADFRLVAATNQPIGQALREGRLRSDLYYRLNTFQIEVPPLRDRREDIAPMAAHFLTRFAREEGRQETPRVTAEAMARLRDYPWPGNVRELQNAMQYAFVLAKDELITEAHLPREVMLSAEDLPHLPTPGGNGTAALPPTHSPAPTTTAGHGAPATASLNLEDRERHAILQALLQTHGNKLRAAKILGIHRPTLYNKMRRLGIVAPER